MEICANERCKRGRNGARKHFEPTREYPKQIYCARECGDIARHDKARKVKAS